MAALRIFAIGFGLAVLALWLLLAEPPANTETETGQASPQAVATLAVDPAPTGSVSPPSVPAAPPKPILLANEQAEQSRLAALDDPEPARPEAQTDGQAHAKPVMKRYHKVEVQDAATLKAGDIVIRLRDIEAHPADKHCVGGDGLNWPCGAMAKTALMRLIRYRAVECELPPGGETADMACRCHVAGTDLSAWMVRQGWATPRAEDSELKDAHAEARKERIGLWREGAHSRLGSPEN